jgi:transcriptional regulator with XRE-family HTH domain
MEPDLRPEEVSPLRRARLARNWTLEDLVAAIDSLTRSGSSVTPSLVSAWERSKIRTSIRYRKLLCRVYGLPPEVLFAHQDGQAVVHGDPSVAVSRVVRPHPALLAAMIEIVQGAREFLAVTGSRSRETAYLEAIERVIARSPDLVHHRILFGPPRHQVLIDHLQRLLALRDVHDRPHGVKTLNIGIVDDVLEAPERFFVASESEAVVVVPSLSGAESFDTGVVFGPPAALGLVQHAREAYAAARKVETPAEVAALPVVTEWAAGGGQ